jgi:hypothetical protein
MVIRGSTDARVEAQWALCGAGARGETRMATSNAEENAVMRTINRKLDFEPFGEHVTFGRDL